MNDSFFDDEDDKSRNNLKPIVEVPSEKSHPSSAASTARSHNSASDGNTLSPSNDEDEEDTHRDNEYAFPINSIQFLLQLCTVKAITVE